MGYEGPNQHGRFSLADERRGRSDDGLGTGDAHGPEEEYGEFSNEPLEDTPVVQELDERDEEDDGWDDTSEEPTLLGNSLVCQESYTIVRETEEQAGELGDEVEDVESNSSAQDEQRNDELEQHANNDGVPVDLGPVAGSGPETGNEETQTDEGDGTVGASIVLAFLTGKGADDNNSDCQCSTSWDAHLLWNKACQADSGVIPYPVHGPGDDGNWKMESDQSDHDGQPEQERNHPVLVFAMYDDTGDPPPEIC